ncbi:MAG: hypothetical protein ACI89Z_000639 [Porticoccus sp.]
MGEYGGQSRMLVEAHVQEGVRLVNLDSYTKLHTRICRPVGLDEKEIDALLAFATDRVRLRYDLKNIMDLIRYLIQAPPVPNRWKRRMLSLDSGDIT